jgi:phospholipid-binding lipoprotein MlaA
MKQALLVGVLIVAATGCASRDFSIRSLPDETPAADVAAAVEKLAALAEPAAAAPLPVNGSEASAVTAADAPSLYTYDPWERMNRCTYRFNARLDEQLFLPVANGYRRVPRPLRSGVSHFFSNLSEVKNVANYALQLQPSSGAHSLARLVVNSTLGIGGLFDVATKLNLESNPTGLSRTLSRWGVQPGPFLIIPFLGPATLRDGAGSLGDFGMLYAVNLADLYRGDKSWALTGVNAVDMRSNTNFRYYATGSAFEYETLRFLYVRKALIEDEALRTKPLSPEEHERQAGRPAGQPVGK